MNFDKLAFKFHVALTGASCLISRYRLAICFALLVVEKIVLPKRGDSLDCLTSDCVSIDSTNMRATRLLGIKATVLTTVCGWLGKKQRAVKDGMKQNQEFKQLRS